MEPTGTLAARLDLPAQPSEKSLLQLALTLVRLLHELLERQAIRRMEAGTLDATEIEQVGTALYLQAQELEKLRKQLGLRREDLNLDLGPLGKLFD
jgi:Gas vesicle protein K